MRITIRPSTAGRWLTWMWENSTGHDKIWQEPTFSLKARTQTSWKHSRNWEKRNWKQLLRRENSMPGCSNNQRWLSKSHRKSSKYRRSKDSSISSQTNPKSCNLDQRLNQQVKECWTVKWSLYLMECSNSTSCSYLGWPWSSHGLPSSSMCT